MSLPIFVHVKPPISTLAKTDSSWSPLSQGGKKELPTQVLLFLSPLNVWGSVLLLPPVLERMLLPLIVLFVPENGDPLSEPVPLLICDNEAVDRLLRDGWAEAELWCCSDRFDCPIPDDEELLMVDDDVGSDGVAWSNDSVDDMEDVGVLLEGAGGVQGVEGVGGVVTIEASSASLVDSLSLKNGRGLGTPRLGGLMPGDLRFRLGHLRSFKRNHA